MPGLYLHLPFCSAICPYCDFYVLTGDPVRRRRFVDTLSAEIALCTGGAWPVVGTESPRETFDTLYLGGGTPSILPPEELDRILETLRHALPLDSDLWISIEANPEDVTPANLATWRRLDVRFLSLGVQSFQQENLDFLGRRHTSEQSHRSLELALGAGFHTVSLDLIYGLPHQTREGWQRELEQALDFGPQHLSCYQLTIHEGTPFGFRKAARPAGGAARGRSGRALSLDPPLSRRAGSSRLRGLQLCRRARAPLAPQPEVLGPHPLPRARPLRSLLYRQPSVVERAQDQTLGSAARNRRIAGRDLRRASPPSTSPSSG